MIFELLMHFLELVCTFNQSIFRYGLSTEVANAVVELAKKTQVGNGRVHPVSLFDIWSPPGLMPSPSEEQMRALTVQHAAGLPEDYDAVDVIINVYEKLKPYGIERCTIDADWQKVLWAQLGKLDMSLRREVDANKLIRYHCLLWKTGRGWTYRRTPAEMHVDDAYHPTTLAVFGDRLDVITQLSGEKLEGLNLTEGCLGTGPASVTGNYSDWKEIGVMQFFAETLTIDDPLNGPVSQTTIPVNLNEINRWRCMAATQESMDKGEDSWTNGQSEEEFTLNNSMKKLYDIRPDLIDRMPFGQFMTQCRLIKDENGREHKSLKRLLGDSDIGPLCDRTLIAGTTFRVPRVMRFRNSAIVKLREEKNILPRLVGDNQTLNDASNVYLFHPWRRPEVVFREDNLSSLQDEQLKATGKVRLELFPESYYCTENAT